MAELQEKLVSVFQDFLDSELNSGYVEVVYSKKYGYVIMVEYDKDRHCFNSTYVCETDDLFVDRMCYEYRFAYLYSKGKELDVLDIDEVENVLSLSDRTQLDKQLQNFRDRCLKIVEESN